MKNSKLNNGQPVTISNGNRKLDYIRNWSLMPHLTCSPDACKTCGGCQKILNADGEYIRLQCYDMKAVTQWPSVRTARQNNTNAALYYMCELEQFLNDYLSRMRKKIFRIHTGGDFFSVEYAKMWYRLAESHPRIRFYAYTKQFAIIRQVPFYKLDNFNLFLSAWINGDSDIPDDLREHYKIAYIKIDSTFELTKEMFECPGEHCESCGVCFAPNNKMNIVFNAH